MVIIGICGKIGSGKSTCSAYLIKKFGFVEYSFAKPLKEIAIILGFEHHQIYGSQEQKLEINKFWQISGREFLQKFGTEIGRELLPTILPSMNELWVRLFEKFILDNIGKNIVISDVRFENEAQIIKKYGGIIIMINREVEFNGHKSEILNVSFDYIIDNNNDVEQLYANIDKIYIKINV